MVVSFHPLFVPYLLLYSDYLESMPNDIRAVAQFTSVALDSTITQSLFSRKSTSIVPLCSHSYTATTLLPVNVHELRPGLPGLQVRSRQILCVYNPHGPGQNPPPPATDTGARSSPAKADPCLSSERTTLAWPPTCSKYRHLKRPGTPVSGTSKV